MKTKRKPCRRDTKIPVDLQRLFDCTFCGHEYLDDKLLAHHQCPKCKMFASEPRGRLEDNA